MKGRTVKGSKNGGSRSSVSVTPAGDGWLVKGSTSKRATSVFPSQAEAVAAARHRLRDSGGAIVVQGRDGRLKSTYTVGRKAMNKLNEVEGISVPRGVRKGAAELGPLSPSREQRREQIKTLVMRRSKPGR